MNLNPAISDGRNSRLLLLTILIIMGLTYAVMILFTPLQLDDISMINTYSDLNNDSTGFSARAWAAYCTELRGADNSRIANFLAVIAALYSPWTQLFPWFTGAIFSLTLWAASGLAQWPKDRQWWAAALIWPAMVLFLPWRNNLFVLDYLLNYIWPATLNLTLLWLLTIRSDSLRRPGVLIAASLLALLAGAWHEGFSAPLCCGLAALAICRKFRMSWQWYAISVIFGLSTLFITFCPGVLTRSGKEAFEPFYVSPLKMVIDQAPFAALIIAILLCASSSRLRPRLRKAIANPVFITLTVTAAIAAILSVVVNHTARTSFWPSLCSITAIFLLLRPSRSFCSQYSRLITASAILAVALSLAQGIYAIIWQYRYDREYSIIMQKFASTDSPTVFHDVMMPEDLPLATLYFPARLTWNTGFHLDVLSRSIHRREAAVVPTALRDPLGCDSLITTTLPGGDPGKEIRRTGDALWTSPMPRLARMSVVTLDITLRDGSRHRQWPSYTTNFITLRGDTLAYIKLSKLKADDIVKARLNPYPRLDNRPWHPYTSLWPTDSTP